MSRQATQTGFTTVELIVTILVTASFIATISQMIGVIGGLATTAQNDEIASNIAYNNMRLYANGQSAKFWFVCDNTTNLISYPSASGKALINSTYTSRYQNLPPPVVVKLVVAAPYGCGTTATETMPVRVISTVTYGSSARKVVHATYISNQ